MVSLSVSIFFSTLAICATIATVKFLEETCFDGDDLVEVIKAIRGRKDDNTNDN